jgi:2'-5' RNA ligase
MGGDPRPPRVRLFVAVELPGPVRAEVAEAIVGLRERHRSLRWTDPAGWHVTLAFLGSVPVERVEDVSGALARATAGAAPFSLALSGTAGSFRSGALWAGLDAQPALERLAAAVVHELRPVVGLPDADRPFHPHLTLARGKARASEIAAAAATYRGPRAAWDVGRFVLMRSHLDPRGARYEVVEAFALPSGEDA